MIIDPDRFQLTRQIFDWILSDSYLPSQVVRKASAEIGLTNRFNKKIGRSTIYQILRNPFYYGYNEYPKNSGNWIKGNQVPMITRTEYDRIQQILAKKENPKPERKEFAYTGLIKCAECGAMITAEDKVKKQKNGNVHMYTYFHCAKRTKKHCTQKTLEVKNLEHQILNYLSRISIPEPFIQFALDVLHSNESNDKDKKIR